MLRQALVKSFKPSLITWQARAGYQNYVINYSLSQLERECEQYCPVPRFPPRKVCGEIDRCKLKLVVTVLGAGSDVGRIACLFLKQQKVIRILAMYDDFPVRCVLGVANDLAHIDTSPAVQAYQGRMYLKDALRDADVVLICGGHYVMPPSCNIIDRELFFQNMSFVRTAAQASAQFAPNAVIAVQTPPVDANFALVKHTLKLAGLYDKRKLLGVNSISAMRATQLFCNAVEQDPAKFQMPVIGGTGRCTRVPCFFAEACKFKKIWSQEKAEFLTKVVREADELICRVKSNCEQGHLSIGFATARCVTNIMKGMFEKPAYIDSALVRQGDPAKCFDMKHCSTPLTIGKGGITEYLVPRINAYEKQLLKDIRIDLEDMLNLGRCFALGEDYYLPHEKMYCPYKCEPCPVAKPCK